MPDDVRESPADIGLLDALVEMLSGKELPIEGRLGPISYCGSIRLSVAPISPPTGMKPYYDELLALGRKLVELGRNPHRFTYRRVVLCEIDDGATERAGDGFLRFKPTEDFLKMLAAMRRAATEIEQHKV